jgi:hypothetical protein
VWVVCGAPGSLLLTLFLQEFLHAAKWQLGLMMTLTYLGPMIEPFGAWLAERFGQRRRLFIITYLIARLLFLSLAVVPWLGSDETARTLGIGVVLGVVALSRIAVHLGTPSWWSLMGDLVPDRRRGQFFACRYQAVSAATALSLLIALLLLHFFGGMNNRVLASTIFAGGVLFGLIDTLLYLKIPDRQATPTIRDPRCSLWDPMRAAVADPTFRRLILGMGLWSFSANLVLPFVPVYQRGETLAGASVGLGLSWLSLALLHVVAAVAGMLLSRRWGRWSQRIGPRTLLLVGSGHLFVNLAYLLVGRPETLWPLLPIALLGGGFTAAWTVAANQLLLKTAPPEKRCYYISAYNLINGCLMAGGPLLGGVVADRLPVLTWTLPGRVPCCYFHVLMLLATLGCTAALMLLSRVPAGESPSSPRRAVILLRVLWPRPRWRGGRSIHPNEAINARRSK